MKHWVVYIVFGLGVVVTGCGRKVVPVSSVKTTTEKTDSTTTRTSSADTTNSYIERMVKQILRGSTAGTTIDKNQFDSLVSVIRAMPKGKDTVYLTDPTKEVALRAYYDKVTKQMMFECISKDREYYEKTIEKERIIRLQNEEITKLRLEKQTTSDTVVKVEKGFWERLYDTIMDYIIIVVIIFGIILMIMIDKKFGWIFKRKEP